MRSDMGALQDQIEVNIRRRDGRRKQRSGNTGGHGAARLEVATRIWMDAVAPNVKAIRSVSVIESPKPAAS